MHFLDQYSGEPNAIATRSDPVGLNKYRDIGQTCGSIGDSWNKYWSGGFADQAKLNK